MLIRGHFPTSNVRPGGIAGLALWDHGQRNLNDDDYSKHEKDFYRIDLERKLDYFRNCLQACELQQEADYQSQESRAWSSLDLMSVPGFAAFLLNNRFWAIHAPVSERDITDFENKLHLDWAIRETRAAIDMAFRVMADCVVLHPGTYNPKNRRFWPSPDEALAITNNRRVTLNTSLQALFNHFLYRVEEWQGRVEQFLERSRGVADELRSMFGEFHGASPATTQHYKLASQILTLIHRERIGVDMARYCQNPLRGVKLCMENVEPPNFIVNTVGQLRRVHSRMVELYEEGFERATGLSKELRQRFRPGMCLDTAHMLNSKLVLSEPEHASISHIFEDFEELARPFVSLPGEYAKDSRGQLVEPLLNKFVREGSRDLTHVYVSGARRTDRMMTTHDPIFPLRDRMQMYPRPRGQGNEARFSLRAIDPEQELDLTEVIQVLGPHHIYLTKLFDLPPERHLSSHAHLDAFIRYLCEEERRARARIGAYLEAMKKSAAGVEHARDLEDRLEESRFYLRPHRNLADYWRPGYDEAGFYSFTAEPQFPVDIFATVKEETGAVWVSRVPAEEETT